MTGPGSCSAPSSRPVRHRSAVAAARGAGFLLNATGPARLRFVPPLAITAADLDALAAALPADPRHRSHRSAQEPSP